MRLVSRSSPFPLLLILCFSAACGGGTDDGAGRAEDRYVIIDDDIGFHNRGCLEDGYLGLFRIANPDLEPQWGLLDLARLCDHDGGVQLIYALYKAETDPHLHILGVTTVHGTEFPEWTYQSAKDIVDRIQPQLKAPVPVFMGAPEAASSFGKRTPAVDFIIRSVMGNPHQVEILATGPLTNIATAVQIEPRLPDTWKQVYIGGLGNFRDALVPGYHYLGYDAGVPEMNANGDVRALQYFVQHQRNTTWFSGEASEVHPWGLCYEDWKAILDAGGGQDNFQSYVARELAPWQLMIATIGRLMEWPDGCGNESGTTQVALMLDPQLRGKSVVSAVDVVVNPDRADGSYCEALSDDPTKPRVRIHYSVQGDWGKVKEDAMKAMQHFR